MRPARAILPVYLILSLGGALAMMNLRTDHSRPLATLLQVGGLLVIAIAVLSYDSQTLYPGAAAIMPALGAAALLIGGQGAPESFVSRALSAPWACS